MHNEKRKTNLLLLLLLLITVSAVAVTVWALFFREPTVILAPDYAPREEEENAEPIPDDSGSKLEQPEGGGAVNLIYMTDVTVDLSENSAGLLFGNPQKSTQDMLLQIVVQGQVIAQSGRIVPGKRVMALDLLPGGPKVSPGGYADCKFVVSYYDPESGEKALLQTEIPISLSVAE